MKYSIHLINRYLPGTTTEIGSYLSVRDKTEWKTKQTAEKHALDVLEKPWARASIKIVIPENEYGEEIKSWAMDS